LLFNDSLRKVNSLESVVANLRGRNLQL